MPPTMTTSAMPSAMKPISPACRAVSARLEGERKLSIDRLSAKPTMQKHDHRNGGLGPALGKDFAEQMIGPIAVSQASEGFAHRGPSDSSGVSGKQEHGRPGAIVPGARAAVSRYFFRSLRFQQVVCESALSLVIGISVV